MHRAHEIAVCFCSLNIPWTIGSGNKSRALLLGTDVGAGKFSNQCFVHSYRAATTYKATWERRPPPPPGIFRGTTRKYWFDRPAGLTLLAGCSDLFIGLYFRPIKTLFCTSRMLDRFLFGFDLATLFSSPIRPGLIILTGPNSQECAFLCGANGCAC
jgi:hypothetical protein